MHLITIKRSFNVFTMHPEADVDEFWCNHSRSVKLIQVSLSCSFVAHEGVSLTAHALYHSSVTPCCMGRRVQVAGIRFSIIFYICIFFFLTCFRYYVKQ